MKSRGGDPDFVMQLEADKCVSRITPTQQAMNVDPRATLPTKMARFRRSGNPFLNDTWELLFRKDELLTVIKDHGNDRWLVENDRGEMGFVHATWIDFNGARNWS